ncbi:transglutaminase domain-containing protein [Hymenobacter cavernae]|uniref:Transglutaminase-like domain-containing protein n=1 Tax=Hymenobacter cavernae TaxID=2044852 RepID=A0ABQ1TSF5_9BACT|nr:transglutaminase domain-containing protein [Hymenobacter cavernae]GGF01045.1 hypothetical protein GCM10011383_09830 [Hymenobacter cavernae]
MFTRFYQYALVASLVGYSFSVTAQAQSVKSRTPPPNIYQAVDTKMRQLPDSATHTVGGLARYINASFSTEADKARAAFVWVARNIRYDVENQYMLEFQREPAVVVQETLAKRTGVCRHYAELYSALANQAGLKSYVVAGYGSLKSAVGHVWCATRIDGQWYLMDPTWAAGHVSNDTFVPHLSNEYYKVKPARFIETHMPFDPLWQLLRAPRTPQQFQQGIVPAEPKPAFAFADSVALYEQQTPLQQLHATNRRIERNGVRNGLTFNYLANSRQQEESCHIEAYNDAMQAFSEGANKLNSFIEFFNRQFQPKKTDAQLQQLLPPIAADFEHSRALLATVHLQGAENQTIVKQFEGSLQEAEAKLHNCEAFMAHYLRTGKLLRPTLFMNVSSIGGRNEMMR